MKNIHLSKYQYAVLTVTIVLVTVATLSGLKLIRLPDLPNWLTSAFLGVLAYLAGKLASKLKSASIWGLDLIIIRGFIVAASSLYPDQRGLNQFLNDDYVRSLWYIVSIGLVLMGLSKVLVVAERYKEILVKAKISLSDMIIMTTRFNRDNPGKVVFVPEGTEYIVIKGNTTKTAVQKEEAYGDTAKGRSGWPEV